MGRWRKNVATTNETVGAIDPPLFHFLSIPISLPTRETSNGRECKITEKISGTCRNAVHRRGRMRGPKMKFNTSRKASRGWRGCDWRIHAVAQRDISRDVSPLPPSLPPHSECGNSIYSNRTPNNMKSLSSDIYI